jgi:hypothetical protein
MIRPWNGHDIDYLYRSTIRDVYVGQRTPADLGCSFIPDSFEFSPDGFN